MNGDTLKKSILQLAVMGKLVPQNSKDEPAIKLLEKIAKEREKLIKEGKLKKHKFEPVHKDEIPFEIPKSWTWTRLNNVAEINGGFAFKSSELQSLGVRIIRISDFDEKGFKNNNIVRIKYNETFSEYKLEQNNILLAMTGGTVGKSYFVKEKIDNMYVNQRVATIKINNLLNYAYVNYVILSPLTQNKIYESKNSTNDNISMDTIKNFLIPLPPISEQDRIVKKLEQILSLVEEYGKNEEKLMELNKSLPDKIKQSILQYAVQGKLLKQSFNDEPAFKLLEKINKEREKLIKEGKLKKQKFEPVQEDNILFQIPKSWCLTRLGVFCNIYNGDSINKEEKIKKYSKKISNCYDYIGTKDVGFDNIVDYDNGVYIPKNNFSFKIANKNSILLCMEGGSAGRKIAIVSKDVCFGNKLCCFDPIVISNKFLFYYLQSKVFLDFFRDSMKGLIGGVGTQKLKQIPIPLPPLEEQKRIVEKIDKLFVECNKLSEILS